MKKIFVRFLCILLTGSLLALPSCKKEEPYDPDPDRALVKSYAFTVSSGNQTVTPMRFYVCSEWGEKDSLRTLACGGSGFGALYDTQKDQLPLIPELKLDETITLSHDPNFTVDEAVILFNPNGSDDETVYNVGFEELSLLNEGYYYVAISATAKTERYEQTDHHVFKLIVGNGEYKGSYFALRSGKNSVMPRSYFSWSQRGDLCSDGSGYWELYEESEESIQTLPTLKVDGVISANHAENVTVDEDVLLIDPTDPDAEPRKLQFEQLSVLGKGTYTVVVSSKNEYEASTIGYDHVFKLIIEKDPY